MNRSKDNSTIKILADIKIEQSPYWCEKTDYLGALKPNGKIINKIFSDTGGKILPLFEAIKIFKYRNKYDVVVTGLRTGQFFALVRWIFHFKKPKHIILELMLDEEKTRLIWKIKRLFQKLVFPRVDIIFVSSKSEIENYSARLKIPKEKFRFLPFHTDIIEPRIVAGTGEYILSTGKTGRDYGVLTKAVKDMEQRVIIVSDRLSVQDMKFPPNVEVLIDIPYSKYLELLYNCLFVVVPLKKLLKSTGQVAILEAMGVGKPVIATKTTGTVDYIQSGVNGILVPVGDSEALKDAIKRVVNDNNLYKELAAAALECVKKNHTFEIYVSRVLEAADELIKRPQFN